MLRSVLAIVLGFIVIGVLSIGTDALARAAVPGVYDIHGRMERTPWLLATNAYVFVYAVFGCWLAGRLAPRRPLLHAMVLGLLGFAFNVIGTARQWNTAPAWYHILSLVLVLPAAWLGGRLAERRRASADARVAEPGSV